MVPRVASIVSTLALLNSISFGIPFLYGDCGLSPPLSSYLMDLKLVTVLFSDRGWWLPKSYVVFKSKAGLFLGDACKVYELKPVSVNERALFYWASAAKLALGWLFQSAPRVCLNRLPRYPFRSNDLFPEAISLWFATIAFFTISSVSLVSQPLVRLEGLSLIPNAPVLTPSLFFGL